MRTKSHKPELQPYRAGAPVPVLPSTPSHDAAPPRGLSRAEQYLMVRDVVRKERLQMAMWGAAAGLGLSAVGVVITAWSKGHFFAYGAIFSGGTIFITSVMAAARALMD